MSKEINFERMFKFVWERNHRNCRKQYKGIFIVPFKTRKSNFLYLISLSHTILPSSSNHNISLNSYVSIPRFPTPDTFINFLSFPKKNEERWRKKWKTRSSCRTRRIRSMYNESEVYRRYIIPRTVHVTMDEWEKEREREERREKKGRDKRRRAVEGDRYRKASWRPSPSQIVSQRASE